MRRLNKIPILPLLGLVAAAIIGFSLGLLYWDNPQVANVPKVVAQAEPVLAGLEKEIPKNFADYQVRRTGWTGQRPVGEAVKVPGYEFAISSESLPGLWIHPRQVNDELIVPSQPIDDVWGFVHQRLVGAGFKEISRDSFTRDGETCTVTQELGENLLEIRCSGKKLEKALAEQAKPFVDQYLKAHQDFSAGSIVYGPMVVRSENPDGPIGASKVAGYDLAEATIRHSGDSSIALYYGFQGKWHYVTQADDEFGFSCSDIMKDEHARKAFRHQWCYMRENDEGLRKLDFDVKTESI